MSLKEKFDKAGLTGTTVALPKGKTKDENGDEKDYKTSKETKKLVKESQTKDAKVIKTPGAYVKGVSFANKTEKKKTKANTAADKVSNFAGSFLASANASTLSSNAKNISVLADAIAKSRETATGVKAPIAATKGSVFVNKGYDPQNKERSERETQNLKSLSAKANDYAKTMKEKEESIDTNAKSRLGTVGNVVYDLGKAGTQLATDAVANLLVPGAGLASMGARSFGQGMQTAEEQGKTGARALAYAAGTAAIEAGTEKISAAAKPLKAIYGVGLVDDAMKKLTSKLAGTSKGRQILTEIGRSFAGEATEEALADVLQVPLQNLTLQNGAKFDADMLADTAYDALLGGIMGGVLGTAGNIGAMAQTRAESKGNAKADVIANAMTQAAQKNAQKNAPPVFQTAQKQTEQPVQQEAPQAGTNGNGLTPYTEQEKINLSSGKKNNIISNISDAVSFIKNALSNKQSVNRAYFGKIPDSVADKVLQETGIDIRNYNVILPSDAVRHMFKNHGNPIVENARGQISLTPDLAAQIPEILSAPDKVRLSDKKDAMNRPTLIFEKLMGDYYITAQAVSNGTHSIQTDTLYIRKKNPQDTVSNAETNSSPEQNVRNVPPQGSSINNIPSSAENSNNNSDGIGSKTQNTGTHIDQRTAQSVGARNVKAFQYEHPEVRPYYQTAAEDILADADQSMQMPTGSRKERTMQGNRYVHTTQASAPLRYAMDMGLTRGEIMRGAEDIINDEGAENNANAKRVELVLDKMLTEGYSTMFGKTAEPNAEYINAKQGIPGYQEQAQGEELPIWDMAADEQQRSREVLRDAFVGATMNKNGVSENGGAIYGREGQSGEHEAGSEGTAGERIDGLVRETAGRYQVRINVIPESNISSRGHKHAYSNNGIIYLSENVTEDLLPQILEHEIVHTMKQLEFDPYLRFVPRVESMLVQSEKAKNVLNNVIQHRNLVGENGEITVSYDDLSLQDKLIVLDELNAVIAGGYASNPQYTEALLQDVISDPASYLSEMLDILEQYKARTPRNDGLGAADRGSLNTAYQNLQEQSSRFYDEGANAARPVDVPMFDANGNPISKSASTVMGAKAIPDDAVPLIEQMIADGQLSYQTVKDRDSLARAQETVQKYGFDGAMMEFRKEVNAGKVSKDIMTLGQTLLNSAANNNDGHAVAEILTLYRSINTSAAQALQASSIFRKLDPESQLYGIRRMVDGLNETTRAIKKQYNIEVDPELLNKFTEQKDQAGRDAVMLEIYQNVADQIPATWKEKWDAWRYMAMLTNPRTHIRNIFGNLFFQPVRMLKNGIAAGMESGLSAAGVNIERTKSFGASPELYRACFNDYHNMAQVLGGSKYSEAKSEIEKRRKIFTSAFVGKPLEAVRKANTAALETEDAIFKRITYADSLAGYLKAHGVTAEQLNSGTADSGVLTAGRNYAANEAQKATYQDRNAFSDKVVRLTNEAGVVGDAIMPFKRTPANILARGVEYSPVGAAKAVYDGVTKIKSGEKTAAEVIDEAAAGLTGSGLLALGALLLMNGLVTGSQGDDKDDKWAQLLGHQGYALELPGGTSVTIDWLAPASLPFFMGVEMASAVGENGWSAESVWNALKSVANPMLELSMLQSVNDLIDSVKYAEEAPLAAIIPSAIVSYFSQAIPTVGGQVERFGQDTRMTTYTEKDSKIPTDVQYALGRASAKIPGWDYQQIPYIDAWGQEEKTGTPFMRAFDNFLNPSYVSQVEMDKVEKELQSVRDATGDTSVFPSRAEKSVTIDGEDKNLTANEYVKYAKQLGKEKYTLLKDAVNSDAYQNMSAGEKADFISYAYKYAKAITEYDQFKKEPSSDWMLEARDSGDVVGAICDRVLYGGNEKAKQAVETVGITIDQYNAMKGGMDANGNGAVSQDEAKAYLDQQDFSKDQKAQLWNIINKSWKNNPYQ